MPNVVRIVFLGETEDLYIVGPRTEVVDALLGAGCEEIEGRLVRTIYSDRGKPAMVELHTFTGNECNGRGRGKVRAINPANIVYIEAA